MSWANPVISECMTGHAAIIDLFAAFYVACRKSRCARQQDKCADGRTVRRETQVQITKQKQMALALHRVRYAEPPNAWLHHRECWPPLWRDRDYQIKVLRQDRH